MESFGDVSRCRVTKSGTLRTRISAYFPPLFGLQKQLSELFATKSVAARHGARFQAGHEPPGTLVGADNSPLIDVTNYSKPAKHSGCFWAHWPTSFDQYHGQ